jgi:hypothetical protein
VAYDGPTSKFPVGEVTRKESSTCRFFVRLLKSIEKVCFEYELHIEKQEGEDFLFLFDLLAHTSGRKCTVQKDFAEYLTVFISVPDHDEGRRK